MQERYEKLGAHEGEAEAMLGKAGLAADHPDPETIVAYRHRSFPEEETERIQEHLEHCADCLDLLLLGDDGESIGEPGVLDFEKEMVWARLKAERMEDEAEEARRRAAAAQHKRRKDLMGVAAAILVMVIPLSGWTLHQNSVIADLTIPQLNVSIHDVLENGRRSADTAVTVSGVTVFEIPSGTEFYTVVFPVDTRQEGLFKVELFDSRNKLVWSGQGLEVDEFGYATIGLSRRFLKGGTYRIRVLDREVGGDPIGDYPIVIRYL